MKQEPGSVTKPKWWIWMIGVLVCIGLVLTALNFFFLRPWLAKKLVQEVETRSNGIYGLQLGSIHTSLFKGSLTIRQARLIPDYAAWQKQQLTGKNAKPALLLEVKAKQLHLEGISLFNLLIKKPLQLKAVVLTQPVVHIHRVGQDTSAGGPLHTQVKGLLAGLQVRKIQIDNASLIYKKTIKQARHTAALQGLSLQLHDFHLTRAAFQDSSRVFYARAISLNAKNIDLLLPGGNYRLKTAAAALNTKAKKATVKDLALLPMHQAPALAQRKGRATTWVKLQVPDVRLSQVDLTALYQLSKITIGTMQVRNPDINAYLDRKNFKQTGIKPLPHDLVQELKTGLTIQKILVQNMHIRYEELAPQATKTGTITFENLHATLRNITNDTALISDKNPAVIELQTAVMGKARLQATIKLNLLSPDGHHTITGALGQTEAGLLNGILEPTTFTSIESGTLHKCNFQVSLYRNTATGTMRAYYQDLTVALLSKKEEKRQSFGKKVLSAILNKSVVESENTPAAKDGLRVGEIAVTRKKNRSFFNYWKDCIASGLISSIGIDKPGDKK